jgi:hypothetical protein
VLNLPPSAADARPGKAQPETSGAYLRNPIAGLAMLTPYEAVDAISLLSSMLVADERYRTQLDARTAPSKETEHAGGP